VKVLRFESSRYFWLVHGVGHVVDQARERENLALADELLREIRFKKLDFLCE